MKKMIYDRVVRELTFELDEVDEVHKFMDYNLEVNTVDGIRSYGCGISKPDRDWNITFSLHDGINLQCNMYTFLVYNTHPTEDGGEYFVASGFTSGDRFICHQALSVTV